MVCRVYCCIVARAQWPFYTIHLGSVWYGLYIAVDWLSYAKHNDCVWYVANIAIQNSMVV